MTAPDAPLDVRLVGTTRAQLAALTATAGFIAAVLIWQRRRTVIPAAACNTARRLRTLAQRIEDAGLNMARPKGDQ